MLFQQRLDSTRFLRVELSSAPTDNGGWWTLPVTVIASGLLPQTNQDVSVVLFIGGGGGSGVPTSRSIATQHSLTGGGDLSADRTLSLVGDTASPGVNMVYSTDSGGTRAWQHVSLITSNAEAKIQVSDIVITSNAVYQDTDLITTLVPGAYAIDMFLKASVNTTPDLALELSYSGTVTDFSGFTQLLNSTTSALNGTGYSAMPATITLTVTALYHASFVGSLTVSTSGTLKLQVKQVTSSATSVTFHKNSRMNLRRIN
jgi:hypothetical protein